MKLNQKILSIAAIISACTTIGLAILHFFDYFDGNIDIMMVSLAITMLLCALNQVNNYIKRKETMRERELLKNIFSCYKELLKIFNKDGDSRSMYAERAIRIDTKLMEEVLISNDDKDIQELLHVVKKHYNAHLSVPRDGFSEFHIYRENFEEMREANLKLEKIKDELKKYFDSVK